MEGQLIHFNRARQELAQARDFDEVKQSKTGSSLQYLLHLWVFLFHFVTCKIMRKNITKGKWKDA